jgi:hypothetical protein
MAPAIRPTTLKPVVPEESPYYEIRVRGQLDSTWSTWLGGLDLRCTDDGQTIASGPVPDQAALFGLLERIRDMGLELLSVLRLEPPID